jgi:hypothetical protein
MSASGFVYTVCNSTPPPGAGCGGYGQPQCCGAGPCLVPPMSVTSPPHGLLPPPPDPSLRPTPGHTYGGRFGDTITDDFQGSWGMPGSSPPLYRPRDPPARPSDCTTLPCANGGFCQMHQHGPFCNCSRVQYCGALYMDPLAKCDAKQRERAVRQEDAFKASISMDALNKQTAMMCTNTTKRMTHGFSSYFPEPRSPCSPVSHTPTVLLRAVRTPVRISRPIAHGVSFLIPALRTLPPVPAY